MKLARGRLCWWDAACDEREEGNDAHSSEGLLQAVLLDAATVLWEGQ